MFTETQIVEKSRQLYDIEAQLFGSDGCSKQFPEIINLCEKAFILRNEIKLGFCSHLTIITECTKTKEIVRKLRADKQLKSVELYELFIEEQNRKKREIWEKEIATFSEYYVQQLEYYNVMIEVTPDYEPKISYPPFGPLITSSQLPKQLINQYEELLVTLMPNNYRMSINQCRSLIEIAVFSILISKGIAKNFGGKVCLTDYDHVLSLNQAIRILFNRGLISESCRNDLHSIRRKGNESVHGSLTKSGIFDCDNSKQTILDTIQVIEELFD